MRKIDPKGSMLAGAAGASYKVWKSPEPKPIEHVVSDNMLLAYFAGQALAGQLANPELRKDLACHKEFVAEDIILGFAFEYAEGALVEYKKRTAK